MNVAIVGAAGYTGGMLIRMLLHHGRVGEENMTAVSGSHAGHHVATAHPDLAGSTDLNFAPNLIDTPDVIFLCTGHGKAASWMLEHNVPAETLVID
ncbi:MAG: N-acetyl-gamma-glutamyl-phosphate reductase, partial [Ignavibacteriae bacterium]